MLKPILRAILPSRLLHAIRVMRRVEEAVPGPLTYNQDGMATQHAAPFMADALFRRAYAAGEATGGWNRDIHWRAYIACWCASRAIRLPGDFVECGVWRGGTSRAVMEYTDFGSVSKQFFLCDTYNGMSEAHLTEEEKSRGFASIPNYANLYESVRKTFAGFPNAILVRGTVPETLPQVDAEQVAYLHIDMNCVRPEIAAAEYFWPKLAIGACILLDDYGWTVHSLQREAFDAFAADKGVQVLALPTGQGMIFKE